MLMCYAARRGEASRQTVSWQAVDVQRMLRRGARANEGPPDDWAQPPTPQRAGRLPMQVSSCALCCDVQSTAARKLGCTSSCLKFCSSAPDSPTAAVLVIVQM